MHARMAILLLALALPLAARASDTADAAPFARRAYGPGYAEGRYGPQARQGLLLSIGLGGGAMYLSGQGPGRIGAGDLDFRLGYGVSDRLQLFMDLNADGATTWDGINVGSWTWTMRAQTLLIGDRAGNGLNVNFGLGFGGLTYDDGYGGVSSPTGLALGGGVSWDARITPWMAFSPEFFYTWHEVPNGPGTPSDVASIYGLRLNLLWYLH